MPKEILLDVCKSEKLEVEEMVLYLAVMRWGRAELHDNEVCSNSSSSSNGNSNGNSISNSKSSGNGNSDSNSNSSCVQEETEDDVTTADEQGKDVRLVYSTQTNFDSVKEVEVNLIL